MNEQTAANTSTEAESCAHPVDLSAIKTTSPGYARKRIDGRHKLVELPWSGKINLRGDASNKKFLTAVVQTAACDLPTEVNTLSRKSGIVIYCTGPDEWLIHCDLDRRESLQNELDKALGDIHHAKIYSEQTSL